MLNLTPFRKKDAFTLHTEIVNSKRDPALVRELLNINNEIQSQFEIYQTESGTNTLESIDSLKIPDDIRVKLRNLYNLKNKAIIEIRRDVTTNGRERAVSECQYCTINSVNSMDHIMPKNDFPEFSVNAQNLFPCCTECNGYKSSTWLMDGTRQFLNLYLDILPETRYLFVELVYVNDVITTRFYLENTHGIDENIFQLICSHYEKLHLFERFSVASDTAITSLRNTLNSLPNQLTSAEIESFIARVVDADMGYFGSNYWKSVLQLALSRDRQFLQSCGIDN